MKKRGWGWRRKQKINNLTMEEKVMERKVGRHGYMGWREQDVAKIHRWITENQEDKNMPC